MPTDWPERDVAELGIGGAALARRYGVSEQAMRIQLLDPKPV